MAERVVYLNGNFVPESKASISIFDRGFTSGDGIYEATRTFRHKLFRLTDHIDRLYNSLNYCRIDIALSPAEMESVCTELVERNLALIDQDDDYSLWHVITRGVRTPGTTNMVGPTVAIFVQPVDFARYAAAYLEGMALVTPATRRIPPQCLDPKAKITNKMNHNQALFEAQQVDPAAIPLMLDMDGNLCETDTTNVFFVSKGKLCTPTARTVLGGITRQVVFELAAKLGIEAVEGNFTPFDMYNADEAFLSGTSGSITPVKALNGKSVGSELPGPVTLRLIRAWNELLGYDYVAQAIRHLGDNESKDLMAVWEKRMRTLAP
ncbi:MAG: aminotransferase class IV [Proteobacteria bacterium]|nr:aminotransferase class IV [Pseudomonadota bacterium]MDA1323557.1 aminotransferase class IV [Pseudomonadota bacterium]